MRLSYIFILLAILQFLVAGQVYSQPPEARSGILLEVSTALRLANTEGIARHFNDRVEITIMNDRKVYSLTQAKFVMKKFFSDYPPTGAGFSIVHMGQSESATYAVGDYLSSRGKIEVNMFLKSSGGVYKIDRIRFERK